MSTLKVDTIQDTNAVEMYLCKAWVNFDGTQTEASMIRASGNVSSITDNGTGQYSVNFLNNMDDANYSVTVSTDYNGTGFGLGAKTFTTSSFLIQCVKADLSAYSDKSYINCQVFR